MRALISDSIADRRFIVTLLAVTAALALLMPPIPRAIPKSYFAYLISWVISSPRASEI
jgi:hypothetical protein